MDHLRIPKQDAPQLLETPLQASATFARRPQTSRSKPTQKLEVLWSLSTATVCFISAEIDKLRIALKQVFFGTDLRMEVYGWGWYRAL